MTVTADYIADTLETTVTANMWNPVSSVAGVRTLQITPLDGTTATLTRDTSFAAIWHGNGGTDFEPSLSAIVKLGTAARGKEHRGRVYLPFGAESNMNKGSLDSVTQTACTNAWTAFLTALNTAAPTPLDLVVASYKLRAATDVVSATCEQYLGTQRRRQSRLRS